MKRIRTDAETTQDPNLQGRILVVDDTPDIRLLFSYLLESIGAHISFAENGLIAFDNTVAAWEIGRPFDLILMDLQMPVLDGWLATKQLRAIGYDGAIVAHSASGDHDQRELCQQAGFSDYFDKPVAPEQFLALVAKQIHGNQVTSAAQAEAC